MSFIIARKKSYSLFSLHLNKDGMLRCYLRNLFCLLDLFKGFTISRKGQTNVSSFALVSSRLITAYKNFLNFFKDLFRNTFVISKCYFNYLSLTDTIITA